MYLLFDFIRHDFKQKSMQSPKPQNPSHMKNAKCELLKVIKIFITEINL